MKKIIAMLLFVMLAFGLVACGGNGGGTQEDANRAADYIYSLYSNKEVVTADFELPTGFKLPANQQDYTITWTVTLGNGKTEGVEIKESTREGYVLVDIDESVEEDVPFTLTLTVKDAAGNTASKSIASKVPAMQKLSWQEFMDAESGDAVIIEGVVTGIVECSKENDLYIEDENGGYFIYNMKTKPSELGLKIGMTVKVTGLRGSYSGIAQVTDPTVEIVDSTVKTVEPTDITEEFVNAADLTVDELFLKQSMFVTIKGATILGQNKGNDTYFDFTLGGKTSYVRISTSTSMLTTEADTAIRTVSAEKIGYSADITGLVSVYGGKIYIVPVDGNAFSNVKIAERTPAEQVEFEKSLLANYTTVSASGETTLESAGKLYTDVVVTWTLDKTYDFASITEGKLVVKLPAEETKITLIATLTSGTASTTREYEVTVKAAPTYVTLPVETPVKDTAYKFYLTQVKLDNKVLYFAGAMDGFYLATTEDATAAVDVYFEDAGEGAIRLYFMDGNLKTYISVYEGAKTDGTPTATLTLVPQQDRAITWKYIPAIRGFACTIKIGGTADNHEDGDAKTFYIGTYNTYKTFSLSETSYVLNDDGTTKSGFDVSNFVAHFGTSVDASTVSDEDKIAYEKGNVTLPDSLKAAGETTLPAFGKTYGNVELTWALDKTYDFAKIEGGKLVVTALPAEETVIKLTATLTSGAKSGTADFEITVVSAASAPKEVDTVDTESEYYLTSVNKNGPLYFDGTVSSGRANAKTDYADAVKVKLEATGTAGEYYITFVVKGAKKYLGVNPNAEKGAQSLIISDTATAECVWVVDTTAKTIVSKAMNTRGLASQNTSTYTNFSNYATSNFTKSDYDTTWFAK